MTHPLAGHVRFDANGTAEFATGWDENILPKAAVSTGPVRLGHRGWLHVYATPDGEEAFRIIDCTCGRPHPVRR